MSYTLGRAEFILDAKNEQILETTSRTFAQITKSAQDLTKQLADQNKVRVSDVKAAADIIITEEKKAAQERAKAFQQTLNEASKYLKAEAADFRRVQEEKVAAEKEAAAKRSSIARAIQQQEADIERKRLQDVKEQLQIEKAIRERGVADRKRQAKEAADAERAASKQQGPGSLIPSFGDIGRTSATLLGFGAIASGAVVAREAIVGMTEAVKKQEEAQRSLQAAFGGSATAFKAQADEIAKTFNKTNSEVERGSAAFGLLVKQYGVTTEETKKLIAISVNLQAAYGGDLQQVMKDVSNAIQGEPQALEKYGIALQQNAIKGSQLLTAEEKKLYETMSITEQARIRLRILFNDTSAEGAAAQRANELAGSFDLVTRNIDELSKHVAEQLTPSLKEAVDWIGKTIGRFDEFIQQQALIDQAKKELGIGSFTLVFDPNVKKQIEEQINLIKQRKQAIDDTKKAQAEAVAAGQSLQAEETARQDKENSAIKRQGELIVESLKKAAKARIDDIQEQIQVAERRKQLQIQILQDQEKEELRVLDDVNNARKAASELELARLKDEKEARLRAVEDRLKLTELTVEREKDALHDVTEETIRQLKIRHDAEVKAAEKKRDDNLKILEKEHEDREQQFRKESRQIDDNEKRKQRAQEDTHKKNLKNLEDEADKERSNHEKILRQIDARANAEEDRHRKRTRNIEDEANKAKDDIDAQIKGIQDVQRARDDARRASDITRRISDAQRNLTLAQGTGTPEQLGDARAKLASAIRIGDPVAVKKAQDELVAISGRGNEEILKAQRELSDAQDDLVDHNLKTAEDAQIAKLQAEKDAIDKTTEREKRQEEDRNIRRKRRLDADKDAEKDRLDLTLKSIDKRKDAENKADVEFKRRLDDATTKLKRSLQDRETEEQLHYKHQQERVRETFDKERDEIEETYNGEAHGYIPTLRRALSAADDHFKERLRLAHEEADKEKREIADIYDNATNGLFAQHARAERATEIAYEKQKNIIRDKYELARQEVEHAYKALDGKSGIIDKLEDLKNQTEKNLNDDLEKWKHWQDGLVGPEGVMTKTWAKALADFDEFKTKIEGRGGINIPAQIVWAPVPGGVGPPIPPGWRPGQGNSGGGNSGGGGSPSMPPTIGGSSGQPAPSSGQVDMSPDRYNYRLGFAARYNGSYKAAPGWEEDGNTAAWPNGPTRHKGQDLTLPGPNNGYGQPIGAFVDGNIIQTHSYTGNPYTDPGGTYVVTEANGKTNWYMHLKGFVKNSGFVHRGDLIGYLGDTGTEDIAYPHLHYEVRDGRNNGSTSLYALQHGIGSLDPVPSIKGYDGGNLFTNPTLTYDMINRKLGVLAENGPELLLGRVNTAALYGSGPTQDVTSVGAQLVNAPTNNAGPVSEGDNFVYYGVAPDNIMQRWRDDQRRQRVLRGKR